ncbi:MAG: hypothetical protein AAF409_14690 [Pseudomonadota bacterium]
MRGSVTVAVATIAGLTPGALRILRMDGGATFGSIEVGPDVNATVVLPKTVSSPLPTAPPSDEEPTNQTRRHKGNCDDQFHSRRPRELT